MSMLTALRDYFDSFGSHQPRGRTRQTSDSSTAVPAMVQILEDRTLLAAYLFIDYGDNFNQGTNGDTLITTQGAFQDVANDATAANRILGTTLDDADGNFNAGTRLDIVAQNFTAAERAQMLAVIQRAYLPLDVTVVELTATAQTTADGRNVAGAANMTDVINTLRGGAAASRDAYIFVGTFIVDPGGADEEIYGPDGGGDSPGGTTLDTTDLNAASNVHDDVAVVFSDGGFNFNTMNNIAHEAGHLFGLRHAITDPSTDATTNLFHQAEIMSYRNTNNSSSSMFTRYPMIRGDNNSPGYFGDATFAAAARTITRPDGSFIAEGFLAGQQIVVDGTTNNNGTYTIQNVAATVLTLTAAAVLTNETSATTDIRLTGPVNRNDLAARNGNVTLFDQARNDARILANPNFTFVSGTGAHDIITITRNGANADVTVQAFADAAYTTAIIVPGEADGTYSFSIPLTRTILVYAGDSTDRIVVDADLGVDVQIDGMRGTDSLFVRGKGAASAIYTPGATAPNGIDLNSNTFNDLIPNFSGAVQIGTRSIQFVNFETGGSVQVQDFGNFTFRSPGGSDGLVMNTPASSQSRISGTVNGSTGVVPLTFFGVTTFNLDTSNNDGTAPNDLVDVVQQPVASGLRTLNVNTGAGADRLFVRFANFNLPVAGGGFFYNSGSTGFDQDTIFAIADANFTLSNASLQSTGTLFLGDVEVAVLTGGAGANTFTLLGWTGTAGLDGLDGSDTYNVTFNSLTSAASVNIKDTGTSGTDVANAFGTASDETFLIRTSVRRANEVIFLDGLETLNVNGRAGYDKFDVAASPTMAINIDGGDPLTKPGDSLSYSGKGEAVLTKTSATSGIITQAGLRAVTYISIEQAVKCVGVIFKSSTTTYSTATVAAKDEEKYLV